MKVSLLLAVFLTATANAQCPKWAADDETCPVVGPYEDVWREFYFEGTGEAHLVGILVHAESKMVPSIIEVMADRRMFARIYAITALGLLKEQDALGALTGLLNDETEKEYFRSAALKAIFVIDSGAGRFAASELVINPDLPDSKLRQTAITVLEHPERIPQEWERH